MITGDNVCSVRPTICAHERRQITWEAIFLDERVCIGPFINRSGRSGDNGDANFNSYVYAQLVVDCPRRDRHQDELPRVRAFVLSPRLSMTSGVGPTNAKPACSTLRANWAFSDKKPYLSYRHQVKNQILQISIAGMVSPRVDHIDTVLEGNANNIVLREVRSNGG